MVEGVQSQGGPLYFTNFKFHMNVGSTFPDLISIDYRRKQLWQIPHNKHEVAVLIVLVSLDVLEVEGLVDTANYRKE